MKTGLPPNGDGNERLPIELHAKEISSRGYAHGAACRFDWYNDNLQILCFDGVSDDPLLHVRLNQDGTVAEILVRDREAMRKCVVEGTVREPSQWEKERYFKTT